MLATPTVSLHLQNLKENPGILPLKKGQAYIQIDNWTILKTIRLDNVYTDLNLVITKFSEFQKLISYNKTFPHEFVSVLMHAEHLRDITLDKFRQLIPQRSKRGLINPLGSIIKIITGNLDHDDAIKYDKIILETSKDQTIISKKSLLFPK